MGDASTDDRRALVQDIVRDPIRFLSKGRETGKTCLACIVFLEAVRDEVRGDSSYLIDNPDPVYADFHRSANHLAGHHVALYRLLKSAGYSRIDVSSAVLDRLPLGREKRPRGEAVRTYLAVTRRALDIVFAEPPHEPEMCAGGSKAGEIPFG
jgi:hypothetical protein